MRGKIELRMQTVELATVIARAVETARPVIDTQGHQLTIKLPDEPVWLEGDPVRLSQVLANLLNNAAKYTEQGGKIELTAEREASGVVIRVRDNGLGIAADVLPRIFDLFTQADRSIARSQGGLGIGLTLVRSLVDLHGGSVSAESDGPGKGSQFTVRLPAHQMAPDQSPTPHQPVVGEKLRVLIVDDNVGAAIVLSKLLNNLWHHEVHLAHDGHEAVEQAHAVSPDLVLLDIGLPGLSGYDVARRLRDDKSLNGAFIVALTGYGQEDDRRRSKEAGFDEHLTKPVSIPMLEGVFSRMRRERPTGR
jgi:CheY-like chemotaxis protein/two-component sensor histidine kinase